MSPPLLRTGLALAAALLSASSSARAQDAPRLRVDLELGATGIATPPQRDEFSAGLAGSIRVRARVAGPLGVHATGSAQGFAPRDASRSWGNLFAGGVGVHVAPRVGPGALVVDAEAVLFPGPPGPQGEARVGLALGVGAAYVFRVAPWVDLGPHLRGLFGQLVFAGSVDRRDDIAAWSAGVTASFHPPTSRPPPRDSDGDGIDDPRDRCPAVQEDRDGTRDDDGCPDDDDDGDGVPDALDRCPRAREDLDGFDDLDGCPDDDNDGDGVPDARDACALEPEDPDGVADDDGCPDDDDDHDGVGDALDRCLTQPESRNGFLDDDGCPDEEPARAIVRPGRVDLTRPIAFEDRSDHLRATSNGALDALATLLRERSELVAVRVDANADETPNRRVNVDLSRRRARAVVRALAARGVNPLRLNPVGVGSARLPDGSRVSLAITAGPWAPITPR